MTERPYIHPVDPDEARVDQGVYTPSGAEMARTGVFQDRQVEKPAPRPRKARAEVSGAEMTRRHDQEPLPSNVRPPRSDEVAAIHALLRQRRS